MVADRFAYSDIDTAAMCMYLYIFERYKDCGHKKVSLSVYFAALVS